MAEITVVKAISDYFGPKGGGRKVTLEEMKALSPAEKRELAEGIVAITGETLKAPVGAASAVDTAK